MGLEHVYNYMYLGINLDFSLNFNHIDCVNKVAAQKIFLLSRVRHVIDKHTVLYLHTSMIVPIF